MKLQKLIDTYQEIADVTKPKCGNCVVANSCCAPEFCDHAEKVAGQHGVKLERTGHKTLKFMGPNGCTVPPYLRPICSMHVCEMHYARDAEFAEKYFELRSSVDEMEWLNYRGTKIE